MWLKVPTESLTFDRELISGSLERVRDDVLNTVQHRSGLLSTVHFPFSAFARQRWKITSGRAPPPGRCFPVRYWVFRRRSATRVVFTVDEECAGRRAAVQQAGTDQCLGGGHVVPEAFDEVATLPHQLRDQLPVPAVVHRQPLSGGEHEG